MTGPGSSSPSSSRSRLTIIVTFSPLLTSSSSTCVVYTNQTPIGKHGVSHRYCSIPWSYAPTTTYADVRQAQHRSRVQRERSLPARQVYMHSLTGAGPIPTHNARVHQAHDRDRGRDREPQQNEVHKQQAQAQGPHTILYWTSTAGYLLQKAATSAICEPPMFRASSRSASSISRMSNTDSTPLPSHRLITSPVKWGTCARR